MNTFETARASTDGKICFVDNDLSFEPIVLTNDEQPVMPVAPVEKSSTGNGEIPFSIRLPQVTFSGTASFALSGKDALHARYVVTPDANANILSVDITASLPGKIYRGGTYAFRDGMKGSLPEPGHGFAIAALGEAVTIAPASDGLAFTLERDLCGPLRLREDPIANLFRLRVPFASKKLTKGVPYEIGFVIRLDRPIVLE